MDKLFKKGIKGDTDISIVSATSDNINLVLDGQFIDDQKSALIGIVSDKVKVCIGHLGKRHVFLSNNPEMFHSLHLIIEAKKFGNDRFYISFADDVITFTAGRKSAHSRIRVFYFIHHAELSLFRVFDSLAISSEDAELCEPNGKGANSLNVISLGYLAELFPGLLQNDQPIEDSKSSMGKERENE